MLNTLSKYSNKVLDKNSKKKAFRMFFSKDYKSSQQTLSKQILGFCLFNFVFIFFGFLNLGLDLDGYQIANLGKHANGHYSQLPMAPISITRIDLYYDRVRVRLGCLTW